MKRGSLISVAIKGDYGKPRPALVIQSDYFDTHPSIVILPITSTLVDAPLFRVSLQPDSGNNLSKPSQVMVDKVTAIAKDKAGKVFGEINSETLLEIERCLAVFLGIAH